jgi:hypothetical protein
MKHISSIYNDVLLMFKTPTNSSKEFKIILLLFSMTGVAIILLSTSLYGAGLSPDSVYYISTARNIASGNGFTSFDGIQMVLWPPLYPLILAIPDIVLHIDPLSSANIINAIFYGMIIYFSGILLSKHLFSSVIYSLLGVIVILFSNALLDLGTMAWSETTFVLLVLIFLVYIQKFLIKNDRSSFIIFTVTAALACLTRYIGICLILTGSLVLFLFYKKSLISRFKIIGLFVLITSIPIGLWIIRNYSINGRFSGELYRTKTSWIQNLNLASNTILNWGHFPPKDLHFSNLLFMFLIIIIVVLSGYIIKRNFSKLGIRLMQILPLVFYVVIYISILIILSSTVKFDSIGWRLMMPVYIPVTILLLFAFDVLLEPLRVHFSTFTINKILALIMTVWLVCYQIFGAARLVHWWVIGGSGFNSQEWRSSEVIHYVKQHPFEQDRKVYSNENAILYILTDIRAQRSPVKIISDSTLLLSDKSNMSYLQENQSYDYFVWFDKYPDSYSITKEKLEHTSNVHKIVQLKDGAIFSIYRIP